MKQLPLLAYLLVVPLLFSACSFTPGDKGYSADLQQDSYIFDYDYQATWKATLDSLGRDHLVLKSEDESYLITEERQLDDALAVEKLGTTAGKYQYKYVVHLLPRDEEHTEINVAVRFRHVVGKIFSEKVQHPLLKRYLQEKLLRRVCGILNQVESQTCTSFYPASQYLPQVADSEPVGEVEAEDSAAVQRRQIASIQEALANRGYDPGVVDGLMGRKTKGALRALQTDLGLPVTGEIDGEVLSALGLEVEAGPEESSIIVETVGVDAGQESAEMEEELVTPAAVDTNYSSSKPSSGRGIVTQSTYLMRNASIMAESVIELPQGTMLKLLERKGSFFKTKYRGREGYVYDRSIQTTGTFK